jgi:hypothetical protein
MDIFQVSRDAQVISAERIRDAKRRGEYDEPGTSKQASVTPPPGRAPRHWLGQVARSLHRPGLIWRES